MYIEAMSEIAELTERLRAFRQMRDWDQFHHPKDIAVSIVLEACELLEHFQWKTNEQAEEYIRLNREEIGDEAADVLIYLIQFCDRAGIDLAAAVQRKIEKNEKNYPADRVKGSAKKYTEYEKL